MDGWMNGKMCVPEGLERKKKGLFINPWSPRHVAAFNGSYKNSPRQKDSCGADRLFGFNVGQELCATHTHIHPCLVFVGISC